MRMSIWKTKTLSFGGSLTLLKLGLGALPSYFMSIFKVPTVILSKLESLRNVFFRGVEKDEKKMSWISWDKVLVLKPIVVWVLELYFSV